ncbi:MAG: LysM peptidoglycan-binding domain-containing protein [Gammaproteobacteria bacterium]|nr:LysM peptidoglycan-binding domain-containing protein [Gammaproteobacteria bacterium]
MVSNQLLNAGAALRAATGFLGLTLLAACSSLGHGQKGSTPPPAATPIASAAAGDAVAPQTVTDHLGDAETTTVISDAAPVLNGSAPMSYTVKRGDTLWGIAGLFLRDPWLWPEIWYVNPQVENPHRIYPGDVLRLATGADGRTQLQLVRGPVTRLAPLLRSEPLEGPIATIPYSAIASFLSRPGVLSKDQVKAAPYVQALRDEHMIAGTGNAVYVKKVAGGVGERYNVMHIGDPLKDPESHDVLGYMAIYTATAQLTRPGDPATATLSDSARETLRGDVLIADTHPGALDFRPHAPARPLKGQVMAIVNGVLLAGQYQVVALNRGASHGIEAGHVLLALESQREINDRCARIAGNGTCRHFGTEKLPIETAGRVMVFKVYPRMSYALVVDETAPIHVGDHVTSP